MSSYEVVRDPAPVKEVVLRLSESDFREIFYMWRTEYPNYYAAAAEGKYLDRDMMTVLINAARECGIDL